MIIFQIFHYSICSLYFIVGDISELHLLFILSPGIIYFRHNSFLSKNFIFSIYYPFSPTYSVFQPYWKICEFLKSQILKNQCSNIVPGTESDILVHSLFLSYPQFIVITSMPVHSCDSNHELKLIGRILLPKYFQTYMID